MGLFLRLNLFHNVEAPDVLGALTAFYKGCGASLVDEQDPERRYCLRHRQGWWCVLEWDGGWEWKIRRAAQLFVSKRLYTAGLLVFVYDGDYWGCELFRNGEVLNRFVQYPPGDGQQNWFPGDPCVGDPEAVARCFPELSVADIKPYLVQQPFYGDRDQSFRQLNEPARPGDQFGRFEAHAVFDFLRAIGVGLSADVWRSFRPHFGGAQQ